MGTKDFFVGKPYASFNDHEAVVNYLQQVRNFCDAKNRTYIVETQKSGHNVKVFYDPSELHRNAFHESLIKRFSPYLVHSQGWVQVRDKVVGVYTINSKSIVDNITPRSYVWLTLIFALIILAIAYQIISHEFPSWQSI